MSGLEILKRMRKAGRSAPVLLLTARDTVEDRVRGLDLGADDFLVKPFAFSELTARLRALFRRGSRGSGGAIRHGDLEMDPARHVVTRAGRAIDLTCGADCGARVLGDPRYLSQLVMNLVGNAVKYTPTGGRVEVALEQRDDHATLSVADTGPGIPKEEQPRIFDRFHRVAGGNGKDGSGLGLAIVAWVAKAHGGEVRVNSVPGEGATFTVDLPVVQGR